MFYTKHNQVWWNRMNILPVNFGNTYNIRKIPSNNNLTAKQTSPLKTDSISFGRTGYIMADALEHQLGKPENVKRMNRIATIYMDILESVAKELKDEGVSFDRTYCQKHAIKSPKAYRSKISRSGSFDVRDGVRATLYCSSLYDLSVLNNKILPVLENRGLVVAKTEVPLEKMLKKGYVPTKTELEKQEILVPDLDIRLYGVDDQLTKLDSKYQYLISSPQGSGYEDIQIRFVRDYDNKAFPVLHELIILPGKNFAKAKYYESDKIYKNTRQLDELNFIKNMKDEKYLALAKRHISIIKSMLSFGISQKLFGCAKNIDVYNINDNIILNMPAQDITVIKNSFSELRKVAKEYYDLLESRVKTDASLKKIKNDRTADSKLLTDLQKNVLESINFFNEIKSFKNLPEMP